MKIVSLVGARPQFVKEALINAAVRRSGAWQHVLVHSGQHYDEAMSDVFFQELGIPAPTHHLGVGSGSHAAMTAAVLVAMENVLLQERPDALLVYGDTNTTLAGGLAAAKLHIPVIHVEAGIRQKPASMPEEINRVVTDHLSSILCCCSDLSYRNLRNEGITAASEVTGDVMYDMFLHMKQYFRPEAACHQYGVSSDGFLVATVHRDFNADAPQALRGILDGLSCLHDETGLPVLLTLHPRTRKNIAAFDLERLTEGLRVLPPLGYVDLMSLVSAAAAVVTDSGGLQKEAYYAGRRSVVVMPDTGWRELVECGWNVLAAPEKRTILDAGRQALAPHSMPQQLYGAGNAAQCIVDFVVHSLGT